MHCGSAALNLKATMNANSMNSQIYKEKYQTY